MSKSLMNLSVKRLLIMDKFTSEELDLLYNLVRDQHDDVMRGDWEAVKDEISQLHLLMYKILEVKPT